MFWKWKSQKCFYQVCFRSTVAALPCHGFWSGCPPRCSIWLWLFRPSASEPPARHPDLMGPMGEMDMKCEWDGFLGWFSDHHLQVFFVRNPRWQSSETFRLEPSWILLSVVDRLWFDASQGFCWSFLAPWLNAGSIGNPSEPLRILPWRYQKHFKIRQMPKIKDLGSTWCSWGIFFQDQSVPFWQMADVAEFPRLRDLVPDPETAQHEPNRSSRQAFGGCSTAVEGGWRLLKVKVNQISSTS